MVQAMCDLVLKINPALPVDYAMRDARARQVAVDGLKNMLQVRRNIIELTSAQAINEGLAAQYDAEAAETIERLAADAGARDDVERLPQHRRDHLMGRLRVYRAKAERARALVVQYQLEIELYRDMLTAGVTPPDEG